MHVNLLDLLDFFKLNLGNASDFFAQQVLDKKNEKDFEFPEMDQAYMFADFLNFYINYKSDAKQILEKAILSGKEPTKIQLQIPVAIFREYLADKGIIGAQKDYWFANEMNYFNQNASYYGDEKLCSDPTASICGEIEAKAYLLMTKYTIVVDKKIDYITMALFLDFQRTILEFALEKFERNKDFSIKNMSIEMQSLLKTSEYFKYFPKEKSEIETFRHKLREKCSEKITDSLKGYLKAQTIIAQLNNRHTIFYTIYRSVFRQSDLSEFCFNFIDESIPDLFAQDDKLYYHFMREIDSAILTIETFNKFNNFS